MVVYSICGEDALDPFMSEGLYMTWSAYLIIYAIISTHILWQVANQTELLIANVCWCEFYILTHTQIYHPYTFAQKKLLMIFVRQKLEHFIFLALYTLCFLIINLKFIMNIKYTHTRYKMGSDGGHLGIFSFSAKVKSFH